MTDVPDLVRVAVVAPIGNSDHSSLSAVISMAQAVFLKRQEFVCCQVRANEIYSEAKCQYSDRNRDVNTIIHFIETKFKNIQLAEQ